MAIVKLNKLSIIGLDENKTEILDALMKMGVVEITSQEEKLTDEEWKEFVTRDGDDAAVYAADVKIAEVSSAIETLEKYYNGKKPLFKTRKPVTEKEFAKFEKEKDGADNFTGEINSISKKISSLKSEENRLMTFITGLKPWAAYDVPLEMRGTKHTDVFAGSIPETVKIEIVSAGIAEVCERAVVSEVSADEKNRFISVICTKEDTETVLESLRKSGFSSIVFEEVIGTAAENIIEFEKQLGAVRREIKEHEVSLTALANEKEKLEYYYDSLVISRDKAAVLGSLVKTERTFYFDGWCPAESQKEIENLLAEKGCYYEFREPEKDEETPVLMRQSKLVEPFQVITDLYSTPSSREIDPTPWLAPFYFIFFGLMLSDAGYGLILSVACFILLKKFRLEGMMYKLVKMFMYCGISTMVWGLLFGGIFGDIIPVFSRVILGKEIVVNPIWFNPVEDPMTLLIFSLILGAIHLFVGMGIQAYMLIKRGQIMDAICDIFLWYILLIGLVLFGVGGMLAPVVKTVGMVMSIIGAAGILITGGRHKKGIGKVTGGLGSLYNITGYLSDVLSYSRLLALGLATGVVAQVINTLGSLAGGGIKGTIVMIIVFAIGTVFNLAINVLGAFVHSSRLQYVEFFGKFFEGGGTLFEPFKRKTKYVDITKEDK